MRRESMMSTPKLMIAAGLAAMVFSTSGAWATVVVSDGFGDADRDNDGAITYKDFDTSASDLVTADSYTPANFPAATINEVTTATDPLDTGIKWFGMNGWTSGPNSTTGVYDPKAYLSIIDDTAGLSPEGNSIDSGLALAIDSKGRGGIAGGFFGQNVALGANVGDQVKVSFDMRLWESAPNANPLQSDGVLNADMRWGLYQDTDNQLGMTNAFAGAVDASHPFGSPAVWGGEDGYFRGDLGVGSAQGDAGWFTRIKLLDGSDPNGLDDPVNGSGPRIYEETNIDPDGSSPSNKRIMEGNDDDFVVKPDQLDPQFTSLVNGKVYNLALTLERTATSILATYTVTNLTDNLTYTLSGEESLTDNTDQPGTGGIQSDNWDYFALRISSASSYQEEDFDLVIDNFMVETLDAAVAIPGDLNGDGYVGLDDLQPILDHWNQNVTVGDPSMGDIAGPGGAGPDGYVGLDDLQPVLDHWNEGVLPTPSAIPEPASLGLLSLGGLAVLRLRR